jgi:GTP-binding protein HflX
VLDGSAPEEQTELMRLAVEHTLEEIGAGDRPIVLALNKIDLLDAAERDELRLAHPEAVLLSAASGDGVGELGERIASALAHTLRELELLLPYSDGGRLAELHDLAGELSRVDTPDGVRVRALVPAAAAERFARFEVAAQRAGV